MKIPIRISQTKDNKYRAACESLPGCVVTAESYEDAKVRVQQAIEGYLASLNVAHEINLETHKKPVGTVALDVGSTNASNWVNLLLTVQET